MQSPWISFPVDPSPKEGPPSENTAAPHCGRDKDESLWRDFNSARERFRQRRESHFNQLEKQFENNRQRKSRILSEAKSIANSTDFRTAFPAMRGLMEQWKATGSAGRDHDQQLWTAFSQARDQLHARAEADRHRAELVKRELLSEASSVAAYVDLREAGLRWRSIMNRWKKAGRASRITEDVLWSRLQGYRLQLDGRYERSKAEREQRSRERIQKLEATVARKRMAIADLENRINEVYARPAVRPGPKQWEIQARRNDKIAQLQSFRDSHRIALAEIEQKLHDAYNKQ